MAFKVGRETLIPIANVKQKTKEGELKGFDYNNDNMLDEQEAGRVHARMKDGLAPRGPEDVYKLAGGRQHDVKQYFREYYEVLHMPAFDFKGNFNVPGLGAGNLRTGRQVDVNNHESFNFALNCDLMDINFLEKNLESATIILGRKGFGKEAGSNLEEVLTIPLSLATAPGYRGWDRGGGSYWVPEQKLLGASVDLAGLKKFAGTEELEFFVKLKTTDGQEHYVNRDGLAFQNFAIKPEELADRGTP